MNNSINISLQNVVALGVGNEGRDIISIIINEYKFSNVRYLHFEEEEEEEDLQEFHIHFKGERTYVYGKKHNIHVINDFDKREMKDLFCQIDPTCIIVLCLAEPISQSVLELVYESTFNLLIRIPFKFENSHNYKNTLTWVELLKNRNRTILFNADRYSSLVKPVDLASLYRQMIHGQAATLAISLKLFPSEEETILFPISFLFRERNVFIFEPEHFLFSKLDFCKKIDSIINQLNSGILRKIKVKAKEAPNCSLYFINNETAPDLIIVLFLLYLFHKPYNLDNSHFWGKDAIPLKKLIDKSKFNNASMNLKIITYGFSYLKRALIHNYNFNNIEYNLNLLIDEYILEFKKYHRNEEFKSSLTTYNQFII